ncbi:glycoside hydrolase superfamily [Collybia nuda]|uniref:chitinase n=1 Tax=Collybia nuda TaxID=64659 RepID=A0A9P5XYK4_9AGAR|nr:glycoside hydrolase superfamily [Collybia nuda]
MYMNRMLPFPHGTERQYKVSPKLPRYPWLCSGPDSSWVIKMHLLALLVSSLVALPSLAFDNSRYDNTYWGQNSYGAAHGTDTANFQKRLSFYCNVSFIASHSQILLQICNPTDNGTFPGTNLANCASLAPDIASCQAKGKIVTLSLGGATGSVGFQSDSQASTFAQTIWDMFLGGSSSTRPFGSAVLDGIDLDIEGGGSTSYATFVNKIRSLASGASKKYYVTAAPQCVFPDGALGGVLNSAVFDAIYGTFYNNPCGLQAFDSANGWNFGIWDNWARVTSPNKNVKVYIGAPASSTASGSGFVSIDTLRSISTQMRKSFPSFGGVMLWDASQAYANNRYDSAIKNSLVAAGGTGFTFPSCSAPAFVAGTNYPGGSKVSFGGCVAKWFATAQPANNPNSDWSSISACTGAGTPTTTTNPTSTPGGSCAGVAAWSSTAVYTGGAQVVYSSHLWTAQWWTQGDTPGGTVGVWVDKGTCAAGKHAAETSHAPHATATSSTTRSRFFRN